MNGDINEMMNRVLSDPEALSGMMKIAKGLMNNGEKNDVYNKDDVADGIRRPANQVNQEAQVRNEEDSVGQGEMSHSQQNIFNQMKLPQLLTYDENRVKLLGALRPYLGDGRRQKVDYILNMMRVLKLMGNGKEGS